MTQTLLDCETELYQEHLEEASFLYEQRLTLFDDPEITWLDIEDFEERFEAHIGALVVGEELALNVCKTPAMEGDFGELHAALRVFCRQNRLDFVRFAISSSFLPVFVPGFTSLSESAPRPRYLRLLLYSPLPPESPLMIPIR